MSAVTDTESSPPALPSSDDFISLDQAQNMSLEITTYFEGGKSMNYQALAGDGDHQATSFGLVQWNFGRDTLGPLLKQMYEIDQTTFAGCFGPNTDYDTFKSALLAGSQADECKWARDRIKNANAAWKDAFTKLGSVAAFNAIQLKQAKLDYHPKALAIIKTMRQICPALFTNVEFRCYAAAFDLGVQQGSLHDYRKNNQGKLVRADKALRQIKNRIVQEKPAMQLDAMKIAVTERGRTAGLASIADCISRRMGILTGSPYEATQGNDTKKRDNPQLSLIVKFGTKFVQDL